MYKVHYLIKNDLKKIVDNMPLFISAYSLNTAYFNLLLIIF